MTPVFCCGFECGTYGTAGQHWDAGINASASTSIVRSGVRSLRINPTASTGTMSPSSSGVAWTNITVIRFYLYIASLPTADATFFSTNAGAGGAGIVFKQSDSKLYIGQWNGTTVLFNSATGLAVTTGQWYRIDYKVNSSANPWSEALSVDGAEVTYSRAVAAATPSQLFLGSNNSNSTYDIYYDDLIISQTNADYPIGAGYINHFVPTSDGTHTATGTTTVKGTLASPTGGGAITSSTTDAYAWVNGVPLLGGATDNTRLINAQTAASTTYVAIKFGPAPGISTPTVAPRAVEVITADRQAATQTGDFQVQMRDLSIGTATLVARGVVAGSTTDRFVSKQFAVALDGSSPWTVVAGAGNFNDLRAQFGYSSDATPDQYWRGIMIEAEFAQVIARLPRPISVGHPFIF